MTEITVKTKNINYFQIVFTIWVGTVFALAVFAGTFIPTKENCIILAVPVFSDVPLWKTVAKLCFIDTFSLWILSMPLGKVVRIAASCGVFFFKGLTMGCSFKIMLCNSVDFITVLMFISYSVIALMSLVYDMFLNGTEERGAICRFAACLAATGASAVIKLAPVILLDVLK